jgi:16S rRNA (guanine527-N7)-methyltransferase
MSEIFNDFTSILKYIQTPNMAHKNRSNWSPYKARKASKAADQTWKAAKAADQTQKAAKPPDAASYSKTHHKKPLAIYELDEAEDRLRDLFQHHGLGWFPNAQRRELARFYRMLMENQNERNFTRLLTLRDVGIKHFVDCLAIIPLLREHGVPLLFPLMDVGTGPGLPGIPLKIAFPHEHIYLAEGVQKRVEFLKKVREELGLSHPDGPLEIYARNVNEECFLPVKGVITRAVEDASNTLSNVIHSLQTGGRVYLMKGPGCDPEIEPALKKWGEYYRLEKDISYELEKTPHKRRLLVFQKIKVHPLPDFEALDLAWEREHGQ